PRARDDLEVVARPDHVRGDLRLRPNDERVVRRDGLGEPLGRELGTHVDLEVLAEEIETRVRQLLRDQDPHGRSPRQAPNASWKTPSAAATAAPRLTGCPSRSSVISSAARPRTMSSSLKYPKWPIRKTVPLSGPCPGAITHPKSDRIRSLIVSASAASGARMAVTVQLSSSPSPNRSSPSACAPSLTARESVRWRSSATSTPSWKYSSSAACRPCITLIAGVHGFSGSDLSA